jgi:hypothetical protein
LKHAGGVREQGFDDEAIKEQIKENEAMKVREFRESYRSDDNKMHGLVALGEARQALTLAKKVYGVLHGNAALRAGRLLEPHEIGNYLDAEERKNFNDYLDPDGQPHQVDIGVLPIAEFIAAFTTQLKRVDLRNAPRKLLIYCAYLTLLPE